jgi:hypothetical protein
MDTKRTNVATTPKGDMEASESELKCVCYTGLTLFGAVLLLLIGGICFLF